MPITVKEYIRLSPRILDELSQSARAGVNAAARAVTVEGNRAVAVVLGSDQVLSHMPRSKKIRVYFKAAKSAEHPVAIVGVSGPAHLIERPRKGGYVSKSKRRRAYSGTIGLIDLFESTADFKQMRRAVQETGRRPALALPDGNFRAQVKPGPITNPLAPVTKTFARADRIIQKVAEDAVHGRFHRNGWGD